MKRVFLIILVLIGLNAKAQDTIKVLFIGNSFTSQNNLPALFSQLAQGMGDNVVVASHMPGGMSVGDIAQGTSAHMNNPLVFSLIRSNNWDYLVLQDNQGRFCLGYGQFPSSSQVIAGHIKIRDSLLYYHPCAHMIWYAGFGPKNGYLPYASTGKALIDSIYQNYQFLRDTAGQIMAPIGPAFQKIITDHPTINLWDIDDTHPSLHGSFLIANIIYATVFKRSALSGTYNPGLSSNVDTILTTIGYQTTFDSVNHTGLSDITPIISQTANDLSIMGYQDCNWFFNNSPAVSNNCNTTISQPGNYYAITTDNNGCLFRTFEQTYFMTGIQDNFSEGNLSLNVYPNPATTTLTIEDNSIIFKAELFDLSGKLLLSKTLLSHQIDISTLTAGMYFIKLTTAEGNIVRKFVKE